MVTPATSGAYTQYANDDMMGEALSRIGIRADQVNADHITEATRSTNLMLAAWAAEGFKQYELQYVTINVGPDGADNGTGTLPSTLFPTGTLQLFSGIIRVVSTFDVPMVRISIYDYEQIPFKQDVGRPDRFVWYGIGNQVNSTTNQRYAQLWPIPGDANWQVKFWCITRAQDAGYLVDQPDVGYEWQDAFCAGLAARLARKYRPDIAADMKTEAVEAYLNAKQGERERGPARFRVDYRTRESPR